MPELPSPVKNRRRSVSHHINRGVKLRLVLDDMLFALLASLLAIGILYVLSNREIGDSMYSAHLSIKQTRELLENGVKAAGLVTFVAVLAFGYWSMIDAHRIAGPMHRLHRLLREVAAGDLTHEIKFRKKDEFQEIAAAADTVVDVFAVKIGALTEIAAQLDSELKAPNLDRDRIAALSTNLAGELAYFTLPQDGKPDVDTTPIGDDDASGGS
jgi:methyl-accepting chemotaxis protein